MKDSFVYRVKGTVRCVKEEGLYEAYSPRQTCFMFCREHKIGIADDVPRLSVTKCEPQAYTDVNDKKETFYAENGGILDD